MKILPSLSWWAKIQNFTYLIYLDGIISIYFVVTVAMIPWISIFQNSCTNRIVNQTTLMSQNNM